MTDAQIYALQPLRHGCPVMDARTAPSSQIAGASSMMLRSERLKDIWAAHHKSRANDNPYIHSAEELIAFQDEVEDHPALMTFMLSLIDIERKALGCSEEDLRFSYILDDLYDNLTARGASMSQSAIKAMPKDYKKALIVLRQATGQNKIRPLSALWHTVKHSAHHVKEDMQEHPYLFGSLLALSLGALGFMNRDMAMSGTVYIDPVATTMADLSADDLFDLMENPDATLALDPSLMNLDMAMSCHDHLKQIVGETGANFIKTTLDAANLFPQHCSRLKTLAHSAQENLQGGYDFVNSRLAFLIKDPMTSIGDRVLPLSPFKAAFDNSANVTADFIYALNAVENVVVHGVLMTSAMLLTVKLGTLEDDEREHLRQNVSDFFHRTLRTKPLNYLLSAGGSAYAYMANNGMTPDMVWMGVGGLLGGEIIHRFLRKKHAKSLVHNLLSEAEETLPATSRAPAMDILSGDAVQSGASKQTGWKDVCLNKYSVGLATAAAVTTIDVLATQGQVVGSILGGTAVVLPFMAYNIPEDTALHLVFGAAGAALGGSVLAARKTGRTLSKGARAMQRTFAPGLTQNTHTDIATRQEERVPD